MGDHSPTPTPTHHNLHRTCDPEPTLLGGSPRGALPSVGGLLRADWTITSLALGSASLRWHKQRIQRKAVDVQLSLFLTNTSGRLTIKLLLIVETA